jgi:hypothetical protein
MVPSWNLANNHMIGLPLSNTWLGGGSFLTTPTTKIMYAALIADDVFRLKLNGSILLEIDFHSTISFSTTNKEPLEHHSYQGTVILPPLTLI